MNLARTALTVDKCTPRDRYARTHVSFPTSTNMSSDDFLLDWPLDAFCVPAFEVGSRRRSRSFVPRPSESYHTTPDSSLDLHINRASNPVSRYLENGPTSAWSEYDSRSPSLHPPSDHSSTNTFDHQSSPHDRSPHDVDFAFDQSCLESLDEQLLRSPTDSFFDMCWSSAVEDDVPVPVLQPVHPRVRKRDRDSVRPSRVAPADRDWLNKAPAMMDACRKSSQMPPSPTSPTFSSSSRSRHDAMLAGSESHLLYHNPNESVHFFPIPPQHARRRRRKTNATNTTATTSATAPSVISAKSSGTGSGALKIISNAVSTLTGRRRAKSTV
ncbi:hypothetical protein BV22DRAFT_1122020 [Leucogyrophana mollusca]|uniref:Uncharacterized protein n=1 Tax=Leucogyrophana mollusca TaxID=85980 RepID=A0ACB8B8N7_9AGAM|nr:hypothetical protein BV22DRAFT_1122020 [Leucogyrophana mollusca]